jgi:transaldolase
MASAIDQLNALGQSLWYDNIQRDELENGALARMIAQGDIRGVTSNPTIFNQAISRSSHYDADLKRLAAEGLTAEGIYEELVVTDIRAAADLFRPLYEETEAGDGYVSLEVNPNLAYDTAGTIDEVERLWEKVDRPNLMIKIPGTQEGLEAITKSISAGINVNVTLIFSLMRYADVMAAYVYGLRFREQAGDSIENIASVASFFVSRVDSKVDKRLQAVIEGRGHAAELAEGILGETAVANAKLAYVQFLEVFEGSTFEDLEEQGGRPQRPLWASTSTKNPAYSDVKYIEELIGPNTVNTVPPNALEAFKDHGRVRVTISEDLTEARFVLESLDELGISLDQVTKELEEEGVKAFAESYNSLLETIEKRRIDRAEQ